MGVCYMLFLSLLFLAVYIFFISLDRKTFLVWPTVTVIASNLLFFPQLIYNQVAFQMVRRMIISWVELMDDVLAVKRILKRRELRRILPANPINQDIFVIESNV